MLHEVVIGVTFKFFIVVGSLMGDLAFTPF